MMPAGPPRPGRLAASLARAQEPRVAVRAPGRADRHGLGRHGEAPCSRARIAPFAMPAEYTCFASTLP